MHATPRTNMTEQERFEAIDNAQNQLYWDKEELAQLGTDAAWYRTHPRALWRRTDLLRGRIARHTVWLAELNAGKD